MTVATGTTNTSIIMNTTTITFDTAGQRND